MGSGGGGGTGAGVCEDADLLNIEDEKKDAKVFEPLLMIAAGVGRGGTTNPVSVQLDRGTTRGNVTYLIAIA